MKRLWNEGKEYKLITKLLKVFTDIIDKLVKVKVDDMLLTSRSYGIGFFYLITYIGVGADSRI